MESKKPAAKSSTKKTTAKTSAAPKKTPKPAEPKPVEKVEVLAAAVEVSDPIVPFLIPKDPAYPESYQYFEMNINGDGFIYQRGVWLDIPKSHVDFIIERDEFARQQSKQYEAYTRPGGAQIG